MKPKSSKSAKQRSHIVITTNHKSITIAILLSVSFGPFGMLYSTTSGAVLVSVLGLLIIFLTSIIWLIFAWLLGIIWAALAAYATTGRKSYFYQGYYS